VEHTGEEQVTWGEFTETRLLSEFRDSGVPMIRMRPAVVRLREELNTLYPLAQALPWLQPEGKEIVRQVQDQVGLEKALRFIVVRNDQLLLSDPTTQFVDSAEFSKGIVHRLHPQPDLPHVVLDPLRQFGEPVVRSVPTSVIAEQVRAGDDPQVIADLYELEPDQVWQAIRYELIRGREAQQAA
jgi:uncharacterized protein (DUF433 family)